MVTGIDPAEMAPAVLEHPHFTHIRRRSTQVRRREFRKIRWLTADMNVAPDYTLDAVEAIVTHPQINIRGLLLTLKLPEWKLGRAGAGVLGPRAEAGATTSSERGSFNTTGEKYAWPPSSSRFGESRPLGSWRTTQRKRGRMASERATDGSLAVLRRWRGRLRVIQGMGNVPPMQGVTSVARRNGGWLTRRGNLFTIIPSLIDSLGITAGDIVMSSSSIRFRAGFFGLVLAIVVLIAVLGRSKGDLHRGRQARRALKAQRWR